MWITDSYCGMCWTFIHYYDIHSCKLHPVLCGLRNRLPALYREPWRILCILSVHGTHCIRAWMMKHEWLRTVVAGWGVISRERAAVHLVVRRPEIEHLTSRSQWLFCGFLQSQSTVALFFIAVAFTFPLILVRNITSRYSELNERTSSHHSSLYMGSLFYVTSVISRFLSAPLYYFS